MIKLVVFDWNGTLFSDIPYLVAGANETLKMLGHPPITIETYRKHYETPINKAYMNVGVTREELEQNQDKVAQVFHAAYEPLAARARTRPGARQLLKTLKAEHVSNIILSNHTMEGIYLQLERLKLTKLIDAVLANDQLAGGFLKGKEARLTEYLQKHGLKAEDALIIGDTTEEVVIGKKLGLKTVVITGGAHDTKSLKQAEPDFMIRKLIDLNDVLYAL